MNSLGWKSLIGLLVAVALLAVPSAAYAAQSSHEKAVVTSTNAQRTKHHLVKLKTQSCLQKKADRWAAKMADREKLEHQGLKPILKDCKLKSVGENIAYGYPTAGKVVAAWMASTGHRKNILKPSYRLIAVGAARDDQGRLWHSQLFGTAK